MSSVATDDKHDPGGGHDPGRRSDPSVPRSRACLVSRAGRARLTDLDQAPGWLLDGTYRVFEQLSPDRPPNRDHPPNPDHPPSPLRSLSAQTA